MKPRGFESTLVYFLSIKAQAARWVFAGEASYV
jgi:hypothetical protein